MTVNDIYKIKHRFVTREIGDELVLVPLETNVANMNELFTMNSTACYIWNCIDGKKTEEEIVNLMVEEFNVEPEVAKGDLTSFLMEIGKL